jgi:hypothetical protein
MTYSKIHKLFSNYLKQPDALTNPEKYLGPNWQDVLNFWIYVEGLSKQERVEMWRRYRALDCGVQISANNTARAAADEFVGAEFSNEAWYAACDVTGWGVFGYATWEIIGHHKLLEQNKTLIFLPLCVKP